MWKIRNRRLKGALVGRTYSGFNLLDIRHIIFNLSCFLIYVKYGALGFSSVFIVPWVFNKIEEREKQGLDR